MSSSREYFRVETVARIALRAVEPGDEENARRRVRVRHVPDPIAKHGVEDARIANEDRAMLDLLARISLSLDRIDRRIEELVRVQLGSDGGPLTSLGGEPLTVVVSGSGLSVPLDLKLSEGAVVEAYMDLWDAGLPLIPALVRVVRIDSRPGEVRTALAFSEIAAEDRERLVQLAIRRQSEELLGGRSSRREEEDQQ